MYRFSNFFLLVTISCSIASAINPVVMIPGYGGSQAYVRFNSYSLRFHLWVNPGDFLATSFFTNHFLLNFNSTTGQTSDPPGEKIDFPGWGETWSVETLGPEITYFYYFGDVLRKQLGYVSNKTLRGTPFDFRKSTYEQGEYFWKLRLLIEETYSSNNNSKIMLIAHSMGNLYTLEFLDMMSIEWKQTYIRGFMALSAPLGGSTKIVATLAQGENFNVFFESPLTFRGALRSFPSTYFLLPDPRLWGPGEAFITVNDSKNSSKFYSSANYEEYFLDSDQAKGLEIYRELQRQKKLDYFKAPTGVDELYCIYGTGLDTVSHLIYEKHNLTEWALADKSLYDDGDGSVNTRSLAVCKDWPNVNHVVLPGAEHREILKDKRMLNLLVETLKDHR